MALRSDPVALDLELVDADQHYYEPADAFSRHLAAEHRHAIRWADVEGRKKLIVGDRLYKMIPNPTFDPIAKPGASIVPARGTPGEIPYSLLETMSAGGLNRSKGLRQTRHT